MFSSSEVFTYRNGGNHLTDATAFQQSPEASTCPASKTRLQFYQPRATPRDYRQLQTFSAESAPHGMVLVRAIVMRGEARLQR